MAHSAANNPNLLNGEDWQQNDQEFHVDEEWLTDLMSTGTENLAAPLPYHFNLLTSDNPHNEGIHSNPSLFDPSTLSIIAQRVNNHGRYHGTHHPVTHTTHDIGTLPSAVPGVCAGEWAQVPSHLTPSVPLEPTTLGPVPALPAGTSAPAHLVPGAGPAIDATPCDTAGESYSVEVLAPFPPSVAMAPPPQAEPHVLAPTTSAISRRRSMLRSSRRRPTASSVSSQLR